MYTHARVGALLRNTGIPVYQTRHGKRGLL